MRQFPLQVRNVQRRIDFYVADFYCHEAKLVIEVDGGYHLEIKEEDKSRDEVIASPGLKTMCFTNEDVLANVNDVVKKIDDFLSLFSPPYPS